METLTSKQFNNYINSLSITAECGRAIAQDEVGEVCVIETLNSTCEFNDAIIDGVEYELTENQKESIANLVEGSIENDDAPQEITSFEFYTQIYN